MATLNGVQILSPITVSGLLKQHGLTVIRHGFDFKVSLNPEPRPKSFTRTA